MCQILHGGKHRTNKKSCQHGGGLTTSAHTYTLTGMQHTPTAAATFQPFAPRTRVIHEPRYLSGDALLRDMRDGGFDRLTVTRQPDGSVVVEFAFREDE